MTKRETYSDRGQQEPEKELHDLFFEDTDLDEEERRRRAALEQNFKSLSDATPLPDATPLHPQPQFPSQAEPQQKKSQPDFSSFIAEFNERIAPSLKSARTPEAKKAYFKSEPCKIANESFYAKAAEIRQHMQPIQYQPVRNADITDPHAKISTLPGGRGEFIETRSPEGQRIVKVPPHIEPGQSRINALLVAEDENGRKLSKPLIAISYDAEGKISMKAPEGVLITKGDRVALEMEDGSHAFLPLSKQNMQEIQRSMQTQNPETPELFFEETQSLPKIQQNRSAQRIQQALANPVAQRTPQTRQKTREKPQISRTQAQQQLSSFPLSTQAAAPVASQPKQPEKPKSKTAEFIKHYKANHTIELKLKEQKAIARTAILEGEANNLAEAIGVNLLMESKNKTHKNFEKTLTKEEKSLRKELNKNKNYQQYYKSFIQPEIEYETNKELHHDLGMQSLINLENKLQHNPKNLEAIEQICYNIYHSGDPELFARTQALTKKYEKHNNKQQLNRFKKAQTIIEKKFSGNKISKKDQEKLNYWEAYHDAQIKDSKEYDKKLSQLKETTKQNHDITKRYNEILNNIIMYPQNFSDQDLKIFAKSAFIDLPEIQLMNIINNPKSNAPVLENYTFKRKKPEAQRTYELTEQELQKSQNYLDQFQHILENRGISKEEILLEEGQNINQILTSINNSQTQENPDALNLKELEKIKIINKKQAIDTAIKVYLIQNITTQASHDGDISKYVLQEYNKTHPTEQKTKLISELTENRNTLKPLCVRANNLAKGMKEKLKEFGIEKENLQQLHEIVRRELPQFVQEYRNVNPEASVIARGEIPQQSSLSAGPEVRGKMDRGASLTTREAPPIPEKPQELRAESLQEPMPGPSPRASEAKHGGPQQQAHTIRENLENRNSRPSAFTAVAPGTKGVDSPPPSPDNHLGREKKKTQNPGQGV